MTARKQKSESSTSVLKNPDKRESRDRLRVEAVVRAFRLIEAFSNAPTGLLSLSQLADGAGIDKSGAQRLAHTLHQLGYLEKQKIGFRPGRRWLDRTYDYLRSDPLIVRAHPILVELRRTTEERVALSLFEETTLLYAIRVDSKQEGYYNHLIGKRVPSYCTSGGWAAFACLSDEKVMDILSRSSRVKITPKTTTDISAILRKIAQARDSGYAIGVEEILIGEIAISAVVRDRDSSPLGAVTLTGSLAEWTTEEFERRFSPHVVAVAELLSHA